MKSNTERVPVVTAFLYSKNNIALIKRSEKVGTYRGAWAGFSGYIEHMPLQQAYIELSEEANLSESDVLLKGIGIPLNVDDVTNGHNWLVFPFLFELRDSIEIKTDWETEELAWYQREEIPSLETVPGLNEALNRVWPAFGDNEFWRGLAEIALNQELSATELARRGLGVLGGYVQANIDKMDGDELLRAIRAFAASRPSMSVFPDLAERLMLGIARQGGEFDFDALVTESLSAVDDSTTISADEAAACLSGKSKLFTLSYSEAVKLAILGWSADEKEITIAESGPKNEGIRLANELSEQGEHVHTVADPDIEAVIPLMDVVLVGCDGITSTNEIMNKVGTNSAVMAAKAADIPVYVVTQTFKVAPPDWPVFLELQDFLDNKDGEPEGKPIFDLTPFDEFDAVFTEEGILNKKRLNEIQKELGSVELIL